MSDVVCRTRGPVKRFGALTAVDHLDIDAGLVLRAYPVLFVALAMWRFGARDVTAS